MIGYHYTTYANWLKIQKEGMQPYEVHNQEVLSAMSIDKLQAIWVWKNKLKGWSHKGQILYSAIKKENFKIAVLEIKYDEEQEVKAPWGANVTIKHLGKLENMIYHIDEPAVLLKDEVPPENIKLLKIYDLNELLI